MGEVQTGMFEDLELNPRPLPHWDQVLAYQQLLPLCIKSELSWKAVLPGSVLSLFF